MPSQTPLLVPVSVEALMVNTFVQAGTNQSISPWSRGLVDYSLLSSFDDPLPQPSQIGHPPKIGVHLHWALPKALVHGTEITATATCDLNGDNVGQIALTNPGAGYVVPPTVTITGGGGFGATAVAELLDGAVSRVTIVDAGRGYRTPPRIQIDPSPEICFPLVPNRWLVTRMDPVVATNAPRATTSWIIASDEMSAADGKAHFVNPAQSEGGDVQAAMIGVRRVLSAWAGETGAAGTDLFLRAIGPGELSFHAFQPGAENVFGIYDDLGSKDGTADVPFADGAEFTYQVLGWYSDPQADPLYGEIAHWGDHCDGTRSPWSKAADPSAAWAALMADLNWAVEDAPADPDKLPDSSLYHAMIHSVKWQSVGIPPRINSDPQALTVAIGNTAVDALAELIRAHPVNDPDSSLGVQELEALNFNALKALDKADGPAQIELLIRDAWFSNAPGGTTWEIVQSADDNFAGLSAAAVPPTAPLTKTQKGLLADLNKAQVALDAELRELQSMKWSLFATWWKQERAKHDDDWQDTVHNPQAILDAIKNNLDKNKAGLYADVAAKERAIAKAASALPQPANPVSISEYAARVLKLNPEDWALKAANAAPFHAPVDPVVMVSGLQPSVKQKTHFPKYTQGAGWDDTLLCRTTDQAATGILTGLANPTDVTDATAFSAEIPAVGNAALPPAVQAGLGAMLVETFLCDPLNADTIVQVASNGAGTQAQADRLAGAIADFTAPVAKDGSAWAAAIKEPCAYVSWQQAWSPLYLQWSVAFYPTVLDADTGHAAPGEACDNWAFDLDPWAFNGTDYDWTAGNPAHGATTYTGRTFLTGQANFALISRLHHYVTTANPAEAGLKAMEQVIEKVGGMNFMSQRLTGLTDAMVMRTVNPGNTPSADIAPHIGSEYNETPDPSKGDQTIKMGRGDPFFFPVRGGYLMFSTLEVIDAFGQVLNLMKGWANTGSGGVFTPLRAQGLKPSDNKSVSKPNLLEAVYLQPRVVQPARLNFDFLSAEDDSKILGQASDVNPVSGWILPNHLDRGLMVYDAGGAALGELMTLVDVGGAHNLAWLPAPGSDSAAEDPDKIENAHLRGFVKGLLARRDDGAGFRNFLSSVDEAQWTVDPLGGRKDQNLSVLMGRPLALVRCAVGLELDGLPYANQSWRDTLQNQGVGLDKMPWQIRLGSLELFDDGLMGYFTGDDYSRFHAVHDPEGHTPAVPPYLAPVAPGNYLGAGFDGTDRTLTLLLDPRGDIHLSTGILPVKRVTLPDVFVTPAMGQFAISIRTGPVLTETAQVRAPYPTERHGAWSWSQLAAPAVAGQPAEYILKTLVKAGDEARLDSAPPSLVEGWLTFQPDGKADLED